MNSPVTDERLAYLIAAHANPENWGHSKETVAALTDYATLRRQLREAGEALHGGAQALSSMAHDMEKRKIDKTEGLRAYAAALRSLAAKGKISTTKGDTK